MANANVIKHDSESPYQVITAECDAMLRYAMGSGRALSPSIVEDVAAAVAWGSARALHAAEQLSQDQLDEAKANAPSIGKLSRTHQRLAQVIAPAQPRSLRLLHEVAGYDAKYLWLRMPMPRNMTIVAAVSVIALLAVGTSPLISADPAAGNPLLSSGFALLVNQLFFLSIASLGSCFHGLFKVNEYIIRGTYDPDYSSTYWVRYLLGVISGLILASLISIDESNALYTVARPLLALVGGFSASVVHRILDRLVSTVEDLISSDPKKLADEQQRLAKTSGDARVRDARVDAASALMKLQAKLNDGMTPEQTQAELSRLVKKLVPGESHEDEPPEAADAKPRVNGAAAPELGAAGLTAAEPAAEPAN
ncbi:hypothetical protein DB30_06852 [Enhygromyxa salina]|uniref:Uncharacterized protein n=1 Tax=Enhygromyxa salina TaxID=215803 RepID=A0A0C2D2M5_9BACT|nr:hypothetical protein [Enhygromyxa salina]KIG14377.1 hypothetical protein DB30_06852 [Enhygromyxa salina]